MAKQLIVLILKSPILLLGYLFKHPKLIVLVVIAGFVAGIYFNLTKSNDTPEIPDYQQTAPPFMEANKVVQTYSRIYYVRSMTETDTILWLDEYYTHDYVDGKLQWVFYDKPNQVPNERIFQIYDR